MKYPIARVIAAASALFGIAPATADTPMALDRVDLSLGGYLTHSSADARVDGADGTIGSDVNFEDDFGLSDNRMVGRARFGFLLGDSQGIEIDAYRFHRNASQRLDRSITYDGTTYDVDAQVSGRLNLDLGSVAYRWWIPAGDRDVWGIGVGGGYYRLQGVIDGQATVDGEFRDARVEHSIDAWAPMVDLGWRHAWSRDLRSYIDISGVAKHNGNTTGHIVNAAVGVEYFPWEHLGFGVEYGAQRVHIEASKRNFDGVLTLRLAGPSAFVRMRF